MPPSSSILLLLPLAGALHIANIAPRAHVIMAEDAKTMSKQCALISLSAEDPLRLAKVLKQSWMEGGVKRGLIGSVLIGDDDVQIAAQGPVARLQSFANWIETSSMLVKSVEMMDEDSCPALDMKPKFPLADAEAWDGAVKGSFAGELAEKLKSLSVEGKKPGVTQSNDEGLF